MNNKELKNLAQVAKDHKIICVPVGMWADLMKLSVKMDSLDETDEESIAILKEFQPGTEEDFRSEQLGFTMFGSRFCLSNIVGSGNIRIAKIPAPIIKMSEFRKDGDEHVNRIIDENWSEEISLAEYGNK